MAHVQFICWTLLVTTLFWIFVLSGLAHYSLSRGNDGCILIHFGSDKLLCSLTFVPHVEPVYDGPSPKLFDVQQRPLPAQGRTVKELAECAPWKHACCGFSKQFDWD